MIRIKNAITPRLPKEYQEIEYIESTGTQYIDTNYQITNNTEIIVDGMVLDSGYVIVAGSFGYYMSGIYANASGKICGRWRNGKSSNLTITTSEDVGENRHTFKINNISFYIDDINKGDFNNTYDFETTDNIFIFGLGNRNLGKCRMYSCKIYDDDTLTRDFIPCYRKSDNVIGLYDLVNNIFYENLGDGVFLRGLEVNKLDMNLKPMIGDKKVLRRYVGDKLVYEENQAPYEQVINYTMLYDGSLGESGENGANVCTDVTGGYSKMIARGSATLNYNSDNAYLANTSNTTCNSAFMTNNSVDITDYELLCGRALNNTSNGISSAIAVRNIKAYEGGNDTGISTATDNSTVSNGINSEYVGKVFMYDSDISNIDSGYPYFANYCDTNSKSNLTIYSMFILKQDNWQELCTLADLTSSDYADETTLCANSTAISTILNNEKAVKYMIFNCTGTFMYYFVRNPDCLTILNDCTFKTTIQANEHWNKFLNMVA